MDLFVFACVVFAALLHAGWNAIIKLGVSKPQSMLVLSVGHAALSLPVAIYFGPPQGAIWLWVFGSGLIHVAYQLFLGYAYEQGDISRVYPIARGGAPMIVLVFSALVLSDTLTFFETGGILVLGAGIFLMARGIFSNGESGRLLLFALGSAAATAGYSIVDGLGAREMGNAVAYVAWVMIASGIMFIPAVIALQGASVLRVPGSAWGPGCLAAAMSLLAYAIVVWAMTQAPIALVTALRETSIFFAVLIGWFFLGDRIDRPKVVAAIFIVGGALLTRL